MFDAQQAQIRANPKPSSNISRVPDLRSKKFNMLGKYIKLKITLNENTVHNLGCIRHLGI
jgi:hypothetical protein